MPEFVRDKEKRPKTPIYQPHRGCAIVRLWSTPMEKKKCFCVLGGKLRKCCCTVPFRSEVQGTTLHIDYRLMVLSPRSPWTIHALALQKSIMRGKITQWNIIRPCTEQGGRVRNNTHECNRLASIAKVRRRAAAGWHSILQGNTAKRDDGEGEYASRGWRPFGHSRDCSLFALRGVHVAANGVQQRQRSRSFDW